MPLWFKRLPRSPFPSNIHDAAHSFHSSKKVDEFPAKAEIPLAEADKPLFYLAAERLASRAKKPTERLLAEYSERLLKSKYPTLECLTPDEVQEYSEGRRLSKDKEAHLANCPDCGDLLSAAAKAKNSKVAAAATIARATVDTLRGAAAQSIPTELLGTSGKNSMAGTSTPPMRREKIPEMAAGKFPSYLFRRPGSFPLGAVASAAAAVVIVGTGFVGFKMLFRQKPDNSTRLRRVVIVPQIQAHSNDYLAYAVTEKMIADLGSVQGISVMGSNTSMAFRQKDFSRTATMNTARELGADDLAELSMNVQGDQVRVNAHLINISSDKTIWSKNYTFNLKKNTVWGSSNAMVREIATATGAGLSARDNARLSVVPAIEPSMALSYLNGRYLLWRRTKEDIEASVSIFQNMVEKDPDFAPGWASLADSYNLLALRGFKPAQEMYPKAKFAAENALKLDPELANAHAALALNYLYNDFDWKKAETELKRALELNPSYAEAHQWYGLLLSALKRPDDAFPQLKRAVELEPLSPIIKTTLGGGYFLDGKYDEAIEIYKNILQKAKEDENYSDKKYDLTKENLASAYLQTHRCQEADEILKELPRNKGDLAYEYAVCDQKAKARALIPELEDPFDRAGVYAALGEAEEAFKALDDAYEKRSFHLFQLAVDPAFEPLKSDPRFKDQLRRIKYPM